MQRNAWSIQPRNAALLGILALLSLVTLWAWRVDPLRDSSLRLTDSFVPRERASDSLLLVEIDDATLARYGSIESWPRSLHAQAVDQLRVDGARVVVYDIIFADPKEGDEELRAAMQRTLVVLPVAGVHSILSTAPPQFDTITSPTNQLASASAGLGNANVFVNNNGVARNVPATIVSSAGSTYPALAAVAADRYLRAVSGPLPFAQRGRLRYAGREAPLESNSKLRIAFAGNLQQFHSVSFLDLLSGTVPQGVVQGKLVIIGLTAAGAGDHYDTPAGRMAGVTLQANVIDMLLKRRFLVEVPLGFILPVGLAAAAAIFVVTTRWSLLVGAGATLGAAGGWLITAWLLPLTGRIVDPLYIPLLLGLSLSGGMIWRLVGVQRERLFVLSWFRRVAPPEILRELKDGGLEALQGFEPGTHRLRNYLLLDEIGAGTTGIVNKARREPDGQFVAIKRLYPHLLRSKTAIAEIRREAGALEKLQSPHVVRLIELVEDVAPPFLVLEFVNGRSLRDRLDRD
ncbi:MAG: CHASE2 domain-containing protein, partial [bacterium]